GEDCSPLTAWRPASTNGHIRLGGTTPNENANAYVLFSCQSAHKCVWEAGGYSPMDRGQFNVMNGFHGIVWEAVGYQDALEDYAKAAKWNVQPRRRVPQDARALDAGRLCQQPARLTALAASLRAPCHHHPAPPSRSAQLGYADFSLHLLPADR